MIKSKVLKLLSSFTADELKLFEEYLSSPFLNKNPLLIRLFNLIRKFHPGFNDTRLTKEMLNGKLLGKKESKDTYLRNLFSDLNQKAEEFLSYVNYKSDNSYSIHLLKELYNRDEINIFEKKLRLFEVQTEKDKHTSPGYYHDKAFITEMKTNSKVNKKLVEKYRNLDIENKFYLFLITMMESYCQNFIERQRAEVDHDFSILNYFLDYMQKNISKFQKAPLILVYYFACLCFLNDYNEEYFRLFLGTYKSNKKNISLLDRRNINSLILTYYGEKNKTHSGKYYRDALNLYNEMVDNNYLSHTKSGYIDLIAVRNIIFLCMNLKDRKHFALFIKRIGRIVRPDQRKEINLYANSLYNILLNNFTKALLYLSKINFNSFLESVEDNLYFKNDIKKYTIICFVELGYYENALVQIDTYKHYLDYSRILPKDLKLRNHQFLRQVKEVIFLNMEFDEYRLHLLEKEINPGGEVSSYQQGWLLEKCQQLGEK